MGKMMSLLKEYGLAIAISVVIGLLLNAYVISGYRVSGESMSPTLKNGDLIWVNKLGVHKLERNTIVVAESPLGVTESNGEAKLYIKRVIAVAGDVVTLKDGVLYVNGEANQYTKGYGSQEYSLVASQGVERSLGDLLTAAKSLRLRTSNNAQLHYESDGVHVPDGYVFLLGDNRDNSLDSEELGLFTVDSIVGVKIGN